MGIIAAHLIAITVSYLLDRLFGDPHFSFHPVVLMGRMISYIEKKWNKGRWIKGKGILASFLPAILLFGLSYVLTFTAYQFSIWTGILTEALIIWFMIGGTSMVKEAKQIYDYLSQDDLAKAREQTAMIVSRNTDQMDDTQITRSVLESTGENISDSVTAPFFYAFIGGAPLAVFYRYINTSDAMIGYTSKRFKEFGWAAARSDDVLNYLPARLTALVMTLTVWKIKASSWLSTVLVIKHYAPLHESPNSGYGEAAMAGILHVKLGGPTPYLDKWVKRPYFGNGDRCLHAELIKEGLIVWHLSIIYFISLLWITGGLYYVLA
ncbi:adenosylcobinamide-phosphate synthase CbiB [Alteribacillus sp. YIM 98480]|uniref:adenosylcobinamide-phosphate synthase CbiB n=1 Tax=Alteribacillus sp. YIM 98480 TaxID=2606599 RepID=UPI00131D2B57|nr:adenosylcobinamide-phosphate synthase CbiB [Alteribacillus sp. YIM 98480]